eukprot:m.318880 g.318880  ORF g.318880 m.318880 type:complete len:255 (-) comp20292_c0_seq2:961-1725(-)
MHCTDASVANAALDHAESTSVKCHPLLYRGSKTKNTGIPCVPAVTQSSKVDIGTNASGGLRRTSGSLVQIHEVHGVAGDLLLATAAHSREMIDFFQSAWIEWGQYGERGVQDDSFKLEELGSLGSPGGTRALVPCNASPRLLAHRAGSSIYSQICYYATDRITPIYSDLLAALQHDMAVVRAAALHYNKHPDVLSRENLPGDKSAAPQQDAECGPTRPWVGYVLPTHPGHHACRDNFGVFCVQIVLLVPVCNRA